MTRRTSKEVNEKKPSERDAGRRGLFDKSALLKMGYQDASSCLVMTPITYSEMWEREKANLRRGCPFRQKDLDPYFTVEEIEEARRRLVKDLQGWARAEKRKEYQKAYALRRAEIDKAYAPRRADINNAYAPRRAEIDKARGPRPSGRRINNRPVGGMIVAVDLEGVNLGAPFILDSTGFKTRISLEERDHEMGRGGRDGLPGSASVHGDGRRRRG